MIFWDILLGRNSIKNLLLGSAKLGFSFFCLFLFSRFTIKRQSIKFFFGEGGQVNEKRVYRCLGPLMALSLVLEAVFNAIPNELEG
jgi:hypothetical protein